jgi:hypothetical protein
MKTTRLALAVLTVAIFAACSNDVTGPTNAKSTVTSQDMLGTYGPKPNMLGTYGPKPNMLGTYGPKP